MVKEITNIKPEFAEAKGDEKTGLVIIDFFADWCGPCKRIAPFFAALSEKYPSVGFYKIDADNTALSEVTAALRVKSLPTFCYFVGGQYVKSLLGADPVELEKILLELMPTETKDEQKL